jgi:hypothetical protein
VYLGGPALEALVPSSIPKNKIRREFLYTLHQASLTLIRCITFSAIFKTKVK